MSKFDELRAQCADWEDRLMKNQMQSLQFVLALANGFSDYIGAPKEYIDFDRSKNLRIKPCRVTIDDKGEVHYQETADITKIIELDGDGYCISGITVVIDRDEKVHPKRHFRFAIKFILQKNIGSIYVANIKGDKIDFELDNPDLTPIYERMLSFFQKIFKAEPWDIRGDDKVDFERPIGFLAPETQANTKTGQ